MSDQPYEDPKQEELKMDEAEKKYPKYMKFSGQYKSSFRTELAKIIVHNFNENNCDLIEIAKKDMLRYRDDDSLADYINHN